MKLLNKNFIKINIKYISLKDLNRYIRYIYYKLKKYNYKYYFKIAKLIIYIIKDLLLSKKNQKTLQKLMNIVKNLFIKINSIYNTLYNYNYIKISY